VRSEVRAAYPSGAEKAGKEAVVTMRVLVDQDGAIRNVSVVESGGPEFDPAAVAAMTRFRFWPACSSEGLPVPVRIIYRYIFQLVSRP